jgi:FAD/FMN-containing dehydrogenase
MGHETDALLPSARIAEENPHQLEKKRGFPRFHLLIVIIVSVILVVVVILVIFRWPTQTPSKNIAASKELLKELALQLDGHVLLPKDKDFAEATRVWRQDVVLNHEPLAVIEVASEHDVQLTVPVLTRLSQEYSIPFRIRSGGHSKAGYSTVPGGIVLSLKRLQMVELLMEISIGNETKSSSSSSVVVATVQPGATVETVLDELLEEHDTSGSLGMCGHVAEGGWVLGGGIGFMSRSLGLGIDNVLSFRVVLYNGTLVTTNATSHPELFFALRGAGSGNYGVITSMEYKFLHPMPKRQLASQMEIPLPDVASFLYKIGKQAPSHEFMVIFEIDQKTNGDLTANGRMSWFSPDPNILAKGDERFEQEVAPLLSSASTMATYAPYQAFDWDSDTHDVFDSQGYGTYVYAAQVWQGFLMPVNNTHAVWNDIISLMKEIVMECPDVHPSIELWGGAISDVQHNDTAFAYRDALFNVGVQLYVFEESDSQSFKEQAEKVTAWWPSVAKYLTGAYLNYPMNSLGNDEYPRLYWGSHLERLMKVKRDYDPQNIFSYEQSMPLQ